MRNESPERTMGVLEVWLVRVRIQRSCFIKEELASCNFALIFLIIWTSASLLNVSYAIDMQCFLLLAVRNCFA